MNINKANLAVTKIASVDPTRPNLMNLHVTKEFTEATDGHKLIRVTLPPQVNVEDCPEGVSSEGLIPDDKGWLINRETALSIKPQKLLIPILNDNVFLNKTPDKFSAIVFDKNLQAIEQKIVVEDLEYPDTERVIPKENIQDLFDFRVSYLIEVLQIAQELVGKEGGVNLKWLDKTYTENGRKKGGSSLIIECENSDSGQKFYGLIMGLIRK